MLSATVNCIICSPCFPLAKYTSAPLILGRPCPLLWQMALWSGVAAQVGQTFKYAPTIWFCLFLCVLHRQDSTCRTGAARAAWTHSQAQRSVVTTTLTLTWARDFPIFISLSDTEVIGYHSKKWQTPQASNTQLANHFDLFPVYDVHPYTLRPLSTGDHLPQFLYFLNFNFRYFTPSIGLQPPASSDSPVFLLP